MSEKPWQKLGTEREQLNHLELRLQLSEDVDAILERCFIERKDLAASMNVVFECVFRLLLPSAIFLQTQNEELSVTLYTKGLDESTVRQRCADLLGVATRTNITQGALEWFAMPLDMAGETIGSFGIAFQVGTALPADLVFDLMNAVAEELDNYFYIIQSNRMKHLIIMEMQRCLKSRNLNQAIDLAVNIMGDSVPIQDMLLLYLDEDFEGKKTAQYVVYRDFQKIFDSVEKPMPQLESLLRSGKDLVLPGNRDLEKIIPFDGSTETLLLDGLVVETIVGKMVIRPSEGTGFSMYSREILQVFAGSLRQRLVDFNKEKNVLRQFFAPEVVRKLLTVQDYEAKYLHPRRVDIGVLFSDICGFTKMSEQILKEPEKIASFVDQWSHGVVNALFKEGGMLDKLVGDCVIGLFGPPFYNFSPQQTVIRSLRVAVGVRNFTNDFLRRPENAIIQAHPLFKDFGVAQGINFCPADVGMAGPNHDLTAFSSGMNNTARLQGLAHSSEILVTPAVKTLAEQAEPSLWGFDGPFSAQVKNVQEPLVYFKLKF